MISIGLSITLSDFAEKYLRTFIIRILELVGRKWGIILIGAVNKTDEKGVPFTYYPDKSGKQRNPIAIAQYGMDYWDDFLKSKKGKSKDATSVTCIREKFLNTANWLADNITFKGAFAVWEFNFAQERFNMTPPWVSGMAQGQGMQVLVRAHSLTNESKYLEIAGKALNAFTRDIAEGGVRIKMGNEGYWYEEYASIGGKNPRVLNGMIYALLGVKEYYEYTKDKKALAIFEEGLVALKSTLSKYDGKGFTYYDAMGTRAGNFYDRLHIELMTTLYELTKDEIFRNYYARWKKYSQRHFFIREFVLQPPDRSDILVLTVLFVVILLVMQLLLKC